MNAAPCICGHEKRDHRALLASTRYGACRVCLCDEYVKPKALAVAGAKAAPEPELAGRWRP